MADLVAWLSQVWDEQEKAARSDPTYDQPWDDDEDPEEGGAMSKGVEW